MTLNQVAGELKTLLRTYDAQLAAGQTLLRATQRLAEALAVLETDEVVGEKKENLVDRLVQTQQRAFDEFQTAAQTSDQTGRIVQRRFGLQEWAWDQIRSDILSRNRFDARDSGERDSVISLIAQLDERQQDLLQLMREIARLHTSIESSFQRHLHQLTDRVKIIRQGTMATRAYDAGMKGYSAASALFIDRTR